jgi:hypothetical protein
VGFYFLLKTRNLQRITTNTIIYLRIHNEELSVQIISQPQPPVPLLAHMLFEDKRVFESFLAVETLQSKNTHTQVFTHISAPTFIIRSYEESEKV